MARERAKDLHFRRENRIGGCTLSQIFVRGLAGNNRIYELDVREESVKDLKLLIELAENISSSKQRLIFCGKQLRDEMTLADYNIQQHANLDLKI